MNINCSGRSASKAFTIVELIVVITIIGILAGLSTFGYGNWQKSIAERELKSELTNIASAMKAKRNFENAYPTTPPDNYTASANVNISWGGGDGTAYCIDASSKKHLNITMFVTQDGIIKMGTCAGGEIDSYDSPSYIALSVGQGDTCAIASGAAYCWGQNTNGKLGDGTTTNSNVPVAVSTSGVLAGKTVTAISASAYHTCAIASGAPYCWGHNSFGRLGNGTTTSSSIPVAVNTAGVLAGKTVTAISAGAEHVCAIANGDVFCWGVNNYGKLGNGTTTNSNVPVAVSTSGVLAGKTVTAISAGELHTCIAASGAAFCWGYNSFNNFGNGTTTNSNVPVAVSTSGVLAGKTVTDVGVSSYHSCIVASGSAYCWGSNSFGRLGDGTTTNSSTPVAVNTAGVLAGKTVATINVSALHVCARASGAIYCWGENSYGQYGNASYARTAVPIKSNYP